MRLITVWGKLTGEVDLLQVGRSVQQFERPTDSRFFEVRVSADNAEIVLPHPDFPRTFKLEEEVRGLNQKAWGVWSEPPHKRIVLLDESDLIRLHGDNFKNLCYEIS